jgi:hypothetical protein
MNEQVISHSHISDWSIGPVAGMCIRVVTKIGKFKNSFDLTKTIKYVLWKKSRKV